MPLVFFYYIPFVDPNQKPESQEGVATGLSSWLIFEKDRSARLDRLIHTEAIFFANPSLISNLMSDILEVLGKMLGLTISDKTFF